MAAEVVDGIDGLAPWKDFAHVGPERLAGRYLRRFWHPVYRSEDLAAGRAAPILLMNERFTLYRGESRAAHVMAFRCAHRGTQLSTGWVEGDDLRCFYHGWKYDSTGQCVEQPAEPQPFCEKIRIRSYPVREYLGLVFVYLGEGEPPELPRYPEFETNDEVREAEITETWPCSYYNRSDNVPDLTHVSFTHFNLHFPVPKVEARETDWGVEATGAAPNGRVERLHYIMPLGSQFKVYPSDPEEKAWRDRLAWRIPLDDEHHCRALVTLVHLSGEAAERYREKQHAESRREVDAISVQEAADAVLAGRRTIQDFLEHPLLTHIQDYVTEVGQGAIPDRRSDHLGRSDAGVIILRGIFERELRALAEGRPLKHWRRPERLEVITGAKVGAPAGDASVAPTNPASNGHARGN